MRTLPVPFAVTRKFLYCCTANGGMVPCLKCGRMLKKNTTLCTRCGWRIPKPEVMNIQICYEESDEELMYLENMKVYSECTVVTQKAGNVNCLVSILKYHLLCKLIT